MLLIETFLYFTEDLLDGLRCLTYDLLYLLALQLLGDDFFDDGGRIFTIVVLDLTE